MSNAKFGAAISAMNNERQRGGVPIEGKLYSRVKDRIEVFRLEWGDEYGIDTVVDYSQGFDEGAPIVAIAKITSKDGHVLACGHAVEFVGSSEFTSTSPIEVAETSAIGRALACFGLHGGEYASAQEVEAKRRDGPRNEPDERRQFQGNGPAPDPRGDRPPPMDQAYDSRSRYREPPAPQPSGLYVPDDRGEWEPEADQQRVIAVVESIRTVADLGRYWNEVKPFMAALGQHHLDLTAEIKAAFATANNSLGGK